MNWYKLAQSNDIVFFKFLDYNTSKMKRELPFQGIHAWAASADELEKILQIMSKNITDISIINTLPTDKIYGIRYGDVDSYVTMPSYEDWLAEYGPYEYLSEQEKREYYEKDLEQMLPELEPFDPNRHILRVITRGYDPSWGEGYEDIDNPYQVLIRKDN